MANIQLDPDTYEKCKRTYDELQDGAFSKLQGAMSVVTEQAKESGVADLIKSCEAAEEEGVPALLKAFKNIVLLFKINHFSRRQQTDLRSFRKHVGGDAV